MTRGNPGRTVAAGMLAVCLLLAVPQASEAGVLQPESHDRVETLLDPSQEMTLWDQVWAALSSTWAKVSVLIDPEG